MQLHRPCPNFYKEEQFLVLEVKEVEVKKMGKRFGIYVLKKVEIGIGVQ